MTPIYRQTLTIVAIVNLSYAGVLSVDDSFKENNPDSLSYSAPAIFSKEIPFIQYSRHVVLVAMAIKWFLAITLSPASHNEP